MLVGDAVEVKALNLHTCTVAEVLGVEETPFSFSLSEADAECGRRVSAFAGWFEAGFHGSPENPAPKPVTLSTHPKMGYTHWGQQVLHPVIAPS